MIDKTMLYQTSSIVGYFRAADTPLIPFAGANVIFTGDFHQFPPVANHMGALYCDRPEKDSPQALLGREICLQFDTIVILREQVRVRDPVWMEILRRLREGSCTDEDISEVQKLVLTNNDCEVPDFSTKPWTGAILIMPRHTVRERWNEAALAKHCGSSGNRKYIVHAEDRMSKTEEEVPLCACVKIAGRDDRGAGNLEEIVEIAVGMKAMIVMNISTEANIANGTRGVIKDIILDPREQATLPNEDGAICLKYPQGGDRSLKKDIPLKFFLRP